MSDTSKICIVVHQLIQEIKRLPDIVMPRAKFISSNSIRSIARQLERALPNFWVALLIQPPMIGAIAYAAGNTFKNYYRIRITEFRDQTPDEIKEMAASLLKGKMGK